MCPSCGKPLIALEFEGIEIDHCTSCLGTWLDAGELEDMTRLAGVEPGELSRAMDTAVSHRRGDKKCPRCERRLDLIAVHEGAEIELDRCPHGHGLWFDQGELKEIISTAAGDEEASVARFFAEIYRSELTVHDRGE